MYGWLTWSGVLCILHSKVCHSTYQGSRVVEDSSGWNNVCVLDLWCGVRKAVMEEM